MNYERRMAAVVDALAGAEVDALLVTGATNVRYLTGFSGTNGQVLVSSQGATFFSDPRYAARAADLVRGAEVAIYPTRLRDLLPTRLHAAGVDRLGFEAETLTVAARDDLAPAVEPTSLVATRNIVEQLRRAKEPAEVELVRRAAAIGDDAFEWLMDRLAPGSSERAVALDLEVFVRSHGAEDVAFDVIVASGPLTAHIHHTPSERIIEQGDLVLLDFGALVDGYRSDLTRTVVLGAASERQLAAHALLLEAQAAGIEALRPGASCRTVDGAARAVVAGAGEGDAFGHGLGHGVGLDIHEAPRLHWDSEDALVAGDIVTVEPGLYHVGWGGLRIEDCVLVTERGVEVLSGAPRKELIEL